MSPLPASDVVVHEPVFGKLLILRARRAIVGKGVNAYPAARREDARHLYIFRVHQSHKVFHDDVHAVFVEVAVIAEAEKVQLQALALHHLLGRDILYAYLGKVGLPRDGAQ